MRRADAGGGHTDLLERERRALTRLEGAVLQVPNLSAQVLLQVKGQHWSITT